MLVLSMPLFLNDSAFIIPLQCDAMLLPRYVILLVLLTIGNRFVLINGKHRQFQNKDLGSLKETLPPWPGQKQSMVSAAWILRVPGMQVTPFRIVVRVAMATHLRCTCCCQTAIHRVAPVPVPRSTQLGIGLTALEGPEIASAGCKVLLQQLSK